MLGVIKFGTILDPVLSTLLKIFVPEAFHFSIIYLIVDDIGVALSLEFIQFGLKGLRHFLAVFLDTYAYALWNVRPDFVPHDSGGGVDAHCVFAGFEHVVEQAAHGFVEVFLLGVDTLH